MTPGEPVELQQLVHGYRRGHEMLSASISLEPADADRATKLSDLSGLPISDEQPSYLTCYPLPSGRYYALARTWPDREAPRKGCVLTHTLLVPMAAWSGGLASASVLARHELPARSALEARTTPLAPDADAGFVPAISARVEGVREFSLRYFAQGRSPVVWIDGARRGEEVVPALLDFLWPKLRAAFATCTYSLQPLQAGRRSFDLMFTPVAALPRFSQMSSENVVGRVGRGAMLAAPEEERVVEMVAQALHAGAGHGLEWAVLDRVRAVLPPTPSALRRVDLIANLQERSSGTPAAALAALDVLAALAPGADEAAEAKRVQFEFALKRAEAAGPDRLELLSAIAHRCSRPQFRSLRPRRRELVDLMAVLATHDPKSALALLARASSARVDLSMAVGRGLERVAPGMLAALRPFVCLSLARLHTLLRTSPRLPRLYLEALDGEEGFAVAGEEIRACLSSLLPRSRAAVAREVFKSSAAARAPGLLADALQSASEVDVPAILDAQLVTGIGTKALKVVAQFARDYRLVAMQHLLLRGVTNRPSAQMLAEVLPPDGSLVGVAAALEKGHSDCALDWFVEAVTLKKEVPSLADPELHAAVPKWIVRLLRHDCLDVAERAAAIRAILGSSRNESLWEVMDPADENLPVWATVQQELGTALLPGLTRGYLQGKLSALEAGRWSRTATVSNALRAGGGLGILRHALDGLSVDTDIAGRVWAFVSEAAQALEGRDGTGMGSIPLIENAIAATCDVWPPTASGHWIRVLALGRPQQWKAGPLDAHAVRTCLASIDIPVSEVLLDAFPRVYAATIADGTSPWLDLLWFFADWDRGKDLRAKLIDAYAVTICWPPGNLALTASRAKMLPKMVSRATREGYGQLLQRALEDLEARDGAECAAVARRLRKLFERRDIEIWD